MRRMNRAAVCLACILALVLSLVSAAYGATDADTGHKLNGTWLVTTQLEEEVEPIQVLYTFNSAQNGEGGTLISSGSISLTGGVFACLPDQGNWRKDRDHAYTGTSLGFCFDLTSTPFPGNPSGTIKFHDAFQLSRDGQVLGVKVNIDIIGPDGTLFLTLHGTGSGRRLEIEPPAAATAAALLRQRSHASVCPGGWREKARCAGE